MSDDIQAITDEKVAMVGRYTKILNRKMNPKGSYESSKMEIGDIYED